MAILHHFLQFLNFTFMIKELSLHLSYIILIRSQMKERRPKQSKSSYNDAQNQLTSFEIHQKTRVFQKNLVFVSGLPFDLGDPETLRNPLYFGRYGNVLKIVTKTVPGYKKVLSHQVYATYESELEASLAIAALDGFRLEGRTLKASYGTTKYCTHFLKGYQCQNPDCFFLHQFDEKKEMLCGQSQTAFKQQNKQALNIVCNNMDYLVDKMNQEKDQKEGFPSFTELIKFLVQLEFLEKSQIRLRSQSLKKKKKQEQQPKFIPKIQSRSQYLEKIRKQQKYEEVKQRNIEKQVKEFEQKKQGQQEQKKGQTFQEKGNEKEKQISLADTREFELEDRISKMIIKRLFRTTTKAKSKLNFVKSDKAYTEELVKLRKIIQQYLIVNN